MSIDGLWVYPLKSGAGRALQSATLDRLGVSGDRAFVLTDADGRFLSARADPRISQISFDGQHFSRHGQPSPPLAWAPGAGDVSIWARQQPGQCAADEVNAWFSQTLGRTALLWRLPAEAGLHFGDSNPVMVLYQATVDAIQLALGRPFGAEQLRPNILLSGGQAFAESELGPLSFDGVTLEPVEPCTRCKMINLTPGAEAYPESLDVSRALKSLDVDFVAGMHYRVLTAGTIRR
ncbi:MOSC domain-containing protein [Litorivicinus lipolyticus]|uniref:MOSC domain-containing protein n=1 Tax=Litorivicinus lipolyticus TaxID=418701 RepID=A0A5Q2QGT7_9GAMM|nr:MOSC N-terminal beta barrel domain-containing protein [Litorivicinus lipolyticus]QGG81207.1 MOSC domain-containing protein [Litorivicinus lipolyticus]